MTTEFDISELKGEPRILFKYQFGYLHHMADNALEPCARTYIDTGILDALVSKGLGKSEILDSLCHSVCDEDTEADVAQGLTNIFVDVCNETMFVIYDLPDSEKIEDGKLFVPLVSLEYCAFDGKSGFAILGEPEYCTHLRAKIPDGNLKALNAKFVEYAALLRNDTEKQ